MKTLTIFYDPRCGLCARFRKWLEAQPKSVNVIFTGYGTSAALEKFPRLRELHADREIIVLADDGRWWQGEAAWLTCLWTTREFRPWSFRLAAPVLRPFVKKAVQLLSENRLGLSRLLRLKHDNELATAIRSLADPACTAGTCSPPVQTLHPDPQ